MDDFIYLGSVKKKFQEALHPDFNLERKEGDHMFNKIIEQGNGLLILGRRHKSNVLDKSKDGPHPYRKF